MLVQFYEEKRSRPQQVKSEGIREETDKIALKRFIYFFSYALAFYCITLLRWQIV